MPISRQPAQPTSLAGGGDRRRTSDLSVLVVDREPFVRRVVARLLKRGGYRTTTAGDGESALAALQDGDGVDFLLTDLVLPGMDGRDLALRAREAHPHLKVLFMSGGKLGGVDGDGFDTPPLVKPFQSEELYRSLRSLNGDGVLPHGEPGS